MKKAFLLLPVFLFLLGYLTVPVLAEYRSVMINKTGLLFSNPTDHFRSIATGDWGATTTWESSPDNTNWFAATLTPTSAANTISIRNTHTVTVSTNQNMDQVIIESGGILLHSAATLTVNDDVVGDDIIVQGGGVFTLASAANAPVFSIATATANINTGGILRVSATGLTFAGVGVNANNYIYQNASVLEYTPNLAFATSGVTYFPNANVVTIPIFRITNNMGLVGAVAFTTFNGMFEANGTITFQNSGIKTFRNGIIGTGAVTGDASSGRFVINGTTASLGGSGLLTLPSVDGMDIGPASTVTMVSDKSVTGVIALQANAFVMLGIYNLTMTGDITNGSVTSHIVTNSTGKLVLNNITGVPRIFPVGANTTTVNAMAIFNGGGLNYGVRVEIGINPPISVPLNAVNRTWFVTANGGTPGTVNTNFFYYAGEGNAGFNYTANLELGLYTSVWNVVQPSIPPAGAYQVATTVGIFGNNIEAPLVLANLGAILAVGNNIQLSAQKQNDKALLNWTVDNPSDILQFIPERSADGRVYSSLAELTAADLAFTDTKPLPGLNYYRVKMKDKNGKLTYSNTAVVLNAKKGFRFINISPNPVVNGNFKLNLAAAEKTQVDMLITDMQGRVMHKQTINAIAGSNAVPIHVTGLAKGTYQVSGHTVEARPQLLRFVIQ